MIAESETSRRAATHGRERHPRAGQTMMGAEMILQVLSDNAVDTIFGYSGGAILPTYDAIFRWNEEHKAEPKRHLRLIVPANEQGAGFMAAGYARATGRPGVLLVTSGPGATNCVTPVRDCAADSIPIIMLCGQVPRSAIGSDATARNLRACLTRLFGLIESGIARLSARAANATPGTERNRSAM